MAVARGKGKGEWEVVAWLVLNFISLTWKGFWKLFIFITMNIFNTIDPCSQKWLWWGLLYCVYFNIIPKRKEGTIKIFSIRLEGKEGRQERVLGEGGPNSRATHNPLGL
jgi:hypothetical protein